MKKKNNQKILLSEIEHTLRQELFILLVYYNIAVNAIFDGVNKKKKTIGNRIEFLY